MFRNYLIATLRSLVKHKTSFLINVIGLTLGLTVCGAIGLYLIHELSYDKYHEKYERIFRVVHDGTAGEIPGTRRLATVGPPVGPALKDRFTQVEDAARLRFTPDHIVSYGSQRHYESRIFYADPSLFNIFSFPFVAGDAHTALAHPNNVVITQEIALKYFGDEEALGKTIVIDESIPLLVTGVLKAIPGNTHLKFDILMPFESFRVPPGYPVTLQDWGWASFHTYILLRPGADAAALEASFPSTIVKENFREESAKRFKIRLQPLASIYLGEFLHDQVASGNRVYLMVLSGAALLLLLVAGFNFANLFAVISTARAKEIGVRKMIGAQNRSLSSTVTFQAIGIALLSAGIAAIALPACIATLSRGGLVVASGTAGYVGVIVTLIVTGVVLGIAAGLYPALLMTRLNHQELLKGSFRHGRSGKSMRSVIILIQFVISISLISSVLIIQRQMEFLQSKDLGFAKDELLLLRMPGDQLRGRYPSLKTQLMQNSMVTAVSIGGGRMDGDNGNVPITGEGQTGDQAQPMSIDAFTFDFFKTIGVQLLSGREFTESMPADTLRGVIINLSAAKALGWDEQSALGKSIRVDDLVPDGEVIGVAPDFHFGSLHHEIGPLVMYYPRTRLQDIYVRFSTNDVGTLIESVRQNWMTVAADLPFEYALMNEHLAGLYKSEKSFDMLFRIFAVVAIVIACLGLFGLISQDASYRVREIGIRKVMGAEPFAIVAMMLGPVARVVLLSSLLAFPITWLAMERWLAEFSYRLPFDWVALPIGAAAAMIAAFVATYYKAQKAASANPVNSLRSE